MAAKDFSQERMRDFRRVLKQAGLDGYLTVFVRH